MKKNILVANAWPYANGSLHIGHLAALLGGDILARFQRLKGNKVLFVSGSDCYGSAIEVKAFQNNISPSEISEKYDKEFRKNFSEDLTFSYNMYSKTTDETHIRVVQDAFLELLEKGYIYKKKEKCLYSESLKKFLPDRFVEGECPKCGFKEARGDQCDECGNVLNTTELKNPKVNKTLLKEGENQELKLVDTENFFLSLEKLEDKLKNWFETSSSEWRQNAKQFTSALFQEGLKDRAITRDLDWGVSVPLDEYSTKKIYVWFEAVLGYLSSSIKHSEEVVNNKDYYKEFWNNKDSIHYYFHGKDNIIFHTVIFPGILIALSESKGVDYNLPNYILASEFISMEGSQLSKSRGNVITINDFVEKHDSEILRYYLALHGSETSDANFVFTEFKSLVNGELIGTFGNLINRVCSFVENNFKEGVVNSLEKEEQEKLKAEVEEYFKRASEYLEKGKIQRSFKVVLELCAQGNSFAQKAEPWIRIKKGENVEKDLIKLIYYVQSLSILAQPFLPKTSQKAQLFFTDNPVGSDEDGEDVFHAPNLPDSYIIKDTKPLFEKIEE